jgi:hypothetical protein
MHHEDRLCRVAAQEDFESVPTPSPTQSLNLDFGLDLGLDLGFDLGPEQHGHPSPPLDATGEHLPPFLSPAC